MQVKDEAKTFVIISNLKRQNRNKCIYLQKGHSLQSIGNRHAYPILKIIFFS